MYSGVGPHRYAITWSIGANLATLAIVMNIGTFQTTAPRFPAARGTRGTQGARAFEALAPASQALATVVPTHHGKEMPGPSSFFVLRYISLATTTIIHTCEYSTRQRVWSPPTCLRRVSAWSSLRFSLRWQIPFTQVLLGSFSSPVRHVRLRLRVCVRGSLRRSGRVTSLYWSRPASGTSLGRAVGCGQGRNGGR